MNRRDAIGAIAGGIAAPLLGSRGQALGQEATKKTELGLVAYCCGIRQRAQQGADPKTRLADPLNFIEHGHRLGAGGIQIALGAKDQAYATRLRKQAESYRMFIEGIAGLPRDQADLERFEAEVRTVKQAGADVIRVVMIPGRRYERFQTAAEFRQAADRGLGSLRLAEPIAARHRIRLAVENHKDQRVPERLDVLKRISSEYVGACVDTGNSFALLEDPMEVVRAYAPWAHSVHLKDQAVREYRDGFLLGDVPLGAGFLDLVAIVKTLSGAKPGIRFSLELITRDALEVPCLTEKYWATLADVPGRDLARTLRAVRAGAYPRALPRISDLPLTEQLKQEDRNIESSLRYARSRLGLSPVS